MRLLSPHFTLDELTVTTRPDELDVDGDGDRRERLPNVPDGTARLALKRLCLQVLEPVRELLSVPLRVTSGFRSQALNIAVKGNKASQHLRGEAADVVAVGMPTEQAFTRIAEAVRAGRLRVDQAIVYPSGFIHLSWTAARDPRMELLRSSATRGSGGPYRPWRPT